ncbi:MAG: hypothetical protein J6A37_07060 [Oscillospiraceae bacterium]|nr:hypothetical protein [Oscillospiraceae bacterium]
MDRAELMKCLSEIIGCKLTGFSLACEMMMFDFNKYVIHSQCLTRVVKNGDILFTTLDYQSWDGNVGSNNDLCFFKDKYCNEIIGGSVLSAELLTVNDLKVVLDNKITIELFISNGYHHYDGENEQWRLIKKNPEHNPSRNGKEFSLFHIVVNNKSIEVI